MHKKAMEMVEWAMSKACEVGYDNLSSQDWDDFKDCMEAAEKAAKTDYYYLIVEAMENYEGDDEESARRYYGKRYRMMPDMRDDEKMYYTPMKSYDMPTHWESDYERSKRAYTESKALHHANTPTDKEARTKDLESWMQTMASDIVSLISDATAEEKALIKSRLQATAQKIV